MRLPWHIYISLMWIIGAYLFGLYIKARIKKTKRRDTEAQMRPRTGAYQSRDSRDLWDGSLPARQRDVAGTPRGGWRPRGSHSPAQRGRSVREMSRAARERWEAIARQEREYRGVTGWADEPRESPGPTGSRELERPRESRESPASAGSRESRESPGSAGLRESRESPASLENRNAIESCDEHGAFVSLETRMSRETLESCEDHDSFASRGSLSRRAQTAISRDERKRSIDSAGDYNAAMSGSAGAGRDANKSGSVGARGGAVVVAGVSGGSAEGVKKRAGDKRVDLRKAMVWGIILGPPKSRRSGYSTGSRHAGV